jgi:hypothetical protein
MLNKIKNLKLSYSLLKYINLSALKQLSMSITQNQTLYILEHNELENSVTMAEISMNSTYFCCKNLSMLIRNNYYCTNNMSRMNISLIKKN